MIRLFRFIRAARTVNDHAGNIRQAVDEAHAGFTYGPRQGGKATAIEHAVDARIAAVATDRAQRIAYKESLVNLITAGVGPWQLRTLAAVAAAPRPVQPPRPPSTRRQALAEAAEFLRPASYYQGKPHKAAGDVARLQEWLAGQGVEVTE